MYEDFYFMSFLDDFACVVTMFNYASGTTKYVVGVYK